MGTGFIRRHSSTLLMAFLASFAGGHAEAASTLSQSSSPLGSIGKYLGLNYFTFFDGPGLGSNFWVSPGSLGRPTDSGWSVWTNLSLRGKFSQNLALDVQFRLQQIVTNQFQFRFQGARVGVSGTFIKLGTDAFDLNWTGALNSDLPLLGGQIVADRKLIANPGLFTSLTLRPKGSRFSVYSLVGPRVFFYSDSEAMDSQSLGAGAVPGQKPQLAISISPSLNYDLSEKTALRAGLGIDFRKNMNDPNLRRWFMPVDFGVTHSFSEAISIYPHFRVSGPWDDGLRAELGAAPGTDWSDTASVGLWVNGTIL